MELLLSIILIILVAGLAVIFFLLFKLNKEKTDDQSMVMLQNQINEINKTLGTSLADTQKTMQRQFGQNAKIIQEVTERLTKLDETNKQVMNYSEQLNNLQRILLSQKQRGNLGEASLQLVLENILPPTAYKLQYQFKDGDTVDAVIFTKDGIIPVDAKFSLENYNKIVNEEDETRRAGLEKEFKNDLKLRIDETSKYVKSNQGTLDFAFMFIPAEAIFYDLLINEVGAVKVDTKNLIVYAMKDKKVIIVSPTTFAAYLQTVLQGLRAFKIEEQTKEIIKRVEMLQSHMIRYEEYMKKLGNNLSTTVNSYNSASKEFKKVDKDIVKITGKESKIESLELDKPQISD
ncbi:MAG: DNA recombination protein RmuC [Candidatus Buchananbacteria bacterium]|nr:DNA recombination protein RmuC [Candidatus Buchananbacteria bacterium]